MLVVGCRWSRGIELICIVVVFVAAEASALVVGTPLRIVVCVQSCAKSKYYVNRCLNFWCQCQFMSDR